MDITTQGKCEVCGNDIIMAKWVADIAQPTTCSRKCADKKASGIEGGKYDARS